MLTHQIRLHFIVVIFGFTGILGKLIELPSQLIVVYRMTLACLALALFLWKNKSILPSDKRSRRKWFATGFIVGLHWFFFFESIKLSTVSIALVCFSSTAFFTAILEPIFLRKKFELYELAFSILIIGGMLMVLNFEYQYAKGILFGVLSAFLASLFTVLNSKYVVNNSSALISYYELMGGGILILASIIVFDFQSLTIIPSPMDALYLLILAIVATAFAFVVSISVMKKLSPFTVSLTINLEPLYGIILALFIFGQEELMSTGFYAGFVVILATILMNAILKKRQRKAINSE